MSKRSYKTSIEVEKIKIEEELLIPAAVRAGVMKLAKHIICASGIADTSVGDVTIDGKIALIQPHPESDLYLCPLTPNPHPSYAKAWFYSDCISFEHEVPSIVYPQNSEFNAFKYSFVHSGPTKTQEHTIYHADDGATDKFIQAPPKPAEVSKRYYMNQLLMMLDMVRELRYGPLTYILFRNYDKVEETDIPYTKIYKNVEKELSLYAAALRQGDFLSEYLGYYRVLESVTNTNGKEWIAMALPRLKHHNFGKVAIGHELDHNGPPKNILSVFRRRALFRYRSLQNRFHNDKAIAHYLYNVNRCGIAHGRKSVVKGHIIPTYFEVGRDALLLKLLAKMAIHDKMRSIKY